jgi:hypothetical protein
MALRRREGIDTENLSALSFVHMLTLFYIWGLSSDLYLVMFKMARIMGNRSQKVEIYCLKVDLFI